MDAKKKRMFVADGREGGKGIKNEDAHSSREKLARVFVRHFHA
jgi:hypothetical protein